MKLIDVLQEICKQLQGIKEELIRISEAIQDNAILQKEKEK